MTEIEKGAELLNNAVLSAMKEKISQVDLRDMAEWINTDLRVTRELQNIIMHNFEDIEPRDEELRYIYFNAQTLGFVMLDRLTALENIANKLVETLYKKK